MPRGTDFPRKRRVFRDTDELPTSFDLGADIENALRDSEWLIALCSEDYVQSKWCLREIEEYLHAGRKDRILPILLSGTQETAFPSGIRDLAPAADLRGLDGLPLTRAVHSAIPQLLSRMSGGASAEHIAQSERRRRFSIAMACITALTLGITGFALYAAGAAARIAQNNEAITAASAVAESARTEAIAERNEALMRNASYLSAKAWDALAEGDNDVAITLALEALPDDLHGDQPVSPEAIGVLRMALSMPNRPKEDYTLTRSVKTDFTIRGWISCSDDGLILTTDGYRTSEHYLDYSTGVIEMLESETRAQAIEEGYSMGFYARSGAPRNRVYYGPEKQMRIHIDTTSPIDRYMTLNGEPFYADALLEAPQYYLLAWLEHPAEGYASQTALFHMTRPEAIGALDIEGCPVSASFSANRKRVAVVDEAGVLSLFSTLDASKKGMLPGRWSFVYYPDSDTSFCAVDAEGTAWIYDAVTLTPRCALNCPSAITSLQYCKQKESILACCADGIRIFHWSDGTLKLFFPSDEPPIDAVWNNYNYLYVHDGNSFTVLYPTRADIYTLATETDESDSIQLYQEGSTLHIARALYTPDSTGIVLQHGSGQVSRWDAGTGGLLWYTEEEHHHSDICLSADGTAIWRYLDGLDKFDAASGEKLFSAGWEVPYGGPPIEHPETGRALLLGSGGSSGQLVCFDTQTGALLWNRDFYGKAAFSRDGLEIDCIEVWKRPEDTETGQLYYDDIYYLCLDAATGALIEERFLAEYPGALILNSTTVLSGREQFAAVKLELDASDPVHADIMRNSPAEEKAYRMLLVDPGTGDVTGTLEFAGERELIFPYGGGTALTWTDHTGTQPQDLVCRLYPDGTLGPAYRTDSPEGRALDTEPDEYSCFAGDEVACSPAAGDMDTSVRLIRLSDGVPLISFRGRTNYGLCLAPDGSSFCLYGYWTTPLVVRATDPDTLLSKAQQRMGGEAE